MDCQHEFKMPSIIPQDLRLIQDLIGDEIPKPPPVNTTALATAIPIEIKSDEDSSDDEDDSDSEKEVEANILADLDDEEDADQKLPPSESTSDSESMDTSSDSDSSGDENEDKDKPQGRPSKNEPLGLDEDEESGPAITSESQLRTKNEIAEFDVAIPDIEEVPPDEQLEKVGDVMSIIDKVVIVKGTPSTLAHRGSERALDSDTLLVFEDRKVLGFIYETFGPTHQPLYQIRFNQKFPLDPEKVKISREVYHVPSRSKFVFVSHIKAFKGSDASNAHDEEPAEDEIEFSDDEAERTHKKTLEQRREGARASRQSTPVAPIRDQDFSGDLYGANPYDHSVNDMDFGAGPSRPIPMPYDDPYSDSYGLEDPPAPPASKSPKVESFPEPSGSSGPSRGRGRGNAPMRESFGRQDRGRGRGRDRQRHDRGRGRGRGNRRTNDDNRRRNSFSSSSEQNFAPPPPRPLSPTSLAIARATGQYMDGSSFASLDQEQQQQQQHDIPGYSPISGLENGWSYPTYSSPAPPPYYGGDYQMGFQQSQQYVQPHINPRFASAFGFGMGPTSGYAHSGQAYGYEQYGAGGEYGDAGAGWASSDEWTTSATGGAPPPPSGSDTAS